MNIIIVGPAYPLRGGIAHFNALLYLELRKNHDVSIITFRRQYPALLFPGKTQRETEGELLRVPSEEMVDSINPFNWIATGREIRRRRPDLIIFRYWLPFFGPCFGTIARVARRGTSTRVLYICDNIVPHERRPGDKAFTRYAFRQADFFIVQSGAVEKDLHTLWPGAIYRKVPHPVYSIFGPALPKQEARNRLGISEERVLLFFGYVRAYKGLDVLLEAMAIAARSLRIMLLVVGEFYEDEQRSRALIRSLNLEDRVRLYPEYLPNDQVSAYFSACDAVVLPYRSATQSGIAQIAYNFDKPVISTLVGGLGEVVLDGQTGFLVPAGDPHALAAAIERFYREEKETEFTARVRQEKRKYSWEAMAAAIEELALSSRPT